MLIPGLPLTVKPLLDAMFKFTTPKPLLGDKLMLTVLLPPMIRVLFLRDWRVAVDPLRDIPLPFVVAEIVAVGVPSLIPVTPNSAEEVEVEPKRKSRVEVSFGVI